MTPHSFTSDAKTIAVTMSVTSSGGALSSNLDATKSSLTKSSDGYSYSLIGPNLACHVKYGIRYNYDDFTWGQVSLNSSSTSSTVDGSASHISAIYDAYNIYLSSFYSGYYNISAKLLRSDNKTLIRELSSYSDFDSSASEKYYKEDKKAHVTGIGDHLYVKISVSPKTATGYVELKYSDGTTSRIETKTGLYGATIRLPSISSYIKTGYHFKEWLNSSGTKISTYQNNADVVMYSLSPYFYAYCPANTYYVSYNKNSSDATGSMAQSTFTYDKIGNLSSNNFSRSGYSFAGWSDSSTGNVVYSNGQQVKNLTTVNSGTINLFAKWTANKYTVILDKQNGSGGTSSTTVTYDSPMPTISVPTRYGYDFHGYYSETNGSGTKYYNADGTSARTWDIANNNTTLYAYWIPKTATVYLRPNNGSGTMTSPTFKFGEATALPANTYYRTGYSFVGWHWQQTLILDKSKISDSYDLATQKAKVTHADGAKFTVSNESDEQSLYAIWRNNKYYVKYNGNVEGQGVGGNCQSSDPVTGSMSNSTHYYNISSNLTDNGYSRRGYTFIGWATDSDETSERYTNQASISTLSSTDGGVVDLFAIWQRNTYTITFNANGGSGTTSSLSMLYNNGNYTLPRCGFSRNGYLFEGWSTTPDGAVVYEDGKSVDSYDFEANTILYAKWRATWIAEVPTNHTLSGSGTERDPYIVSTALDLAYLSKQVQKGETYSNGSTRKYFEQTAPINLTGKIWLPIGGNSLGEATTSFGGVYNGRGFAIIGLETYNQTDASGNQLYNNVGLFGRTNGARLENVNISNAKIYGKTNVGALIGENYGKPLEMYGCFARGEINGSTNVGGLLGKDSITGSQISNSGFAGNVTNGSIIAGTMMNETVLSDGSTAGGIIKNCYAEVTTDISLVGSKAIIDACVFSANGKKRYYDDKSPDDGYFTGWVTYDGKPLPSGLTWIGGVEGGAFSLDGYTKVG